MSSPPLPPAPREKAPLDRQFEAFGDRAGSFVRSLLILAEFPGDLSNYVVEPNIRIVRTAFGKWSVELLDYLARHARSSFGELRTALPKVSARVLSHKLRLLEEAGLVERTVRPTRPPRPEYALTERAAAVVRTAAKVLAYVRSTQSPRLPASATDPAARPGLGATEPPGPSFDPPSRTDG